MRYQQSEIDIAIYLKVNEYIEEGIVIPYEDSLLNYLATHVDASNDNIKSNYLDALNSTYSISKCYLFTRYLALAMDKPFKLYEGKLTSLYDGEFQHAWIETEDSVYDVSFLGKWPKKVYYDLFQPKVEKDVDLDNDKKFNHYKRNTIDAHRCSVVNVLKFIDWYRYMMNAQIPNPFGFTVPLIWRYFPQDSEKEKQLDLIGFVYEQWNTKNKNTLDNIPQELLSDELSRFIDERNFIKTKKDLYKELIHFIVKNRDLYEEKKHIVGDLNLWLTAVKSGYSGSLCELISAMPSIVNQVVEHTDTEKIHRH